MKVKTPERIWIDSKGVYPYFYPKEPFDSAFATAEYIRADLCYCPAPAAPVEGDGCKRCGGKGEIVVGKGRHGDTIIEDCPSCTRSQAEELLAAERAETLSWKKCVVERDEKYNTLYKENKGLKADNAAKDARIKELENVVKTSGKIYSAKMRQIEALEAKLAAAEKDRDDWKNLYVNYRRIG